VLWRDRKIHDGVLVKAHISLVAFRKNRALSSIISD